MDKQIQINVEAADTRTLDQLLNFQGELKALSDADFDKLKRVIIKHGITAAIHIWRKKIESGVEATNFMLDGRQRTKVLKALRASGWIVPPLPVAFVDAPNKKIAKEILLTHVSTYGKVTRDGLDMYMLDAGLERQDVGEMMSLDNMEFASDVADPELKEESLVAYTKVNFLITFDPALFSKVSPLLEKVFEIDGVEYEQTAG